MSKYDSARGLGRRSICGLPHTFGDSFFTPSRGFLFPSRIFEVIIYLNRKPWYFRQQSEARYPETARGHSDDNTS